MKRKRNSEPIGHKLWFCRQERAREFCPPRLYFCIADIRFRAMSRGFLAQRSLGNAESWIWIFAFSALLSDNKAQHVGLKRSGLKLRL